MLPHINASKFERIAQAKHNCSLVPVVHQNQMKPMRQRPVSFSFFLNYCNWATEMSGIMVVICCSKLDQNTFNNMTPRLWWRHFQQHDSRIMIPYSVSYVEMFLQTMHNAEKIFREPGWHRQQNHAFENLNCRNVISHQTVLILGNL